VSAVDIARKSKPSSLLFSKKLSALGARRQGEARSSASLLKAKNNSADRRDPLEPTGELTRRRRTRNRLASNSL
jgi:hypothetical protein